MRQFNKKYADIAWELINTEASLSHILDYDIRIAYLDCDEEKKENHKIIFADCTQVSKKYDWCCDYDFFITVYEPNVVDLSEEQLAILMLHELHHVGVDDSGKEPKFYVVPHDVEEFDEIIDRYGLHWEQQGGDI